MTTSQHDTDLNGEATRRAVERIIANRPIQLPDPRFEAATLNAATGAEIQPVHHIIIQENPDADS